VINYRVNRGNPLGLPVPGVILAGMDQGLGLRLMTRKDIGPAHFQGRTLSVDAPDSGFAYVAHALLEQGGMARGRDYQVVSHGGAAGRFEQLLAGRADATLLSGGLAIRARAAGFEEGAEVTWVADPYLGGVLASTQTWLDSHLEIAVRFLAAFITATRWALDPAHRAAAEEMLARDQGLDPAAAAALYALEVDPGRGAIPDGAIPDDALRNVLTLRQHFDGLESEQDLDSLLAGGLVDRSSLRAALATL